MTSWDKTVSFVIPSLKGDTDRLRELKRSILSSTIPKDHLEILAAIGVSPNGRARDRGTIETEGDYLVFMDDDVSFPEPQDLKTIVDFLDQHPDVGLCGPAHQIPESLTEEEKNRALQLSRMHVESPDNFRQTDMVTHACLCISRDLFFEVGMEHPNLISGTDPDLRQKVRAEGLKVGIVPGTRVFHPPLTGWQESLLKNFKGGRRSQAVRREYPQYHLSAEPDKTYTETFEDNNFRKRLMRHLNSLYRRIRGNEWFGLSSQVAYLTGNILERIKPKKWVEPLPYPDPPSPDHPQWKQFIESLENEGRIEWLHRLTDPPE